jgi:hypothetical protein
LNVRTSSIDATYAEGLGRLVNDSPPQHANCLSKKLISTKTCTYAYLPKKNISKGEELRYDYGIKDLPWRKKR